MQDFLNTLYICEWKAFVSGTSLRQRENIKTREERERQCYLWVPTNNLRGSLVGGGGNMVQLFVDILKIRKKIERERERERDLCIE